MATEPDFNKEQHSKQIPENGVSTMFVVKNSETIIWKELKEGDTSALGELYDIYIDDLFSSGMQQAQDKGYVMDCIHDLFFDLYKYRRKLAMTDNVKYYLFKSLKRKINRKYHRKIIPVSMESHLAINEKQKNYTKSHEEVIILSELTSEKSAKLFAALSSLSKKQKKALSLRFNEEKSYQEIAEIMGVSIQTSRTTIYRALKSLRGNNSIIQTS